MKHYINGMTNKVDGISKEHNEVIAKILTGTISKISGTAWTKEGILNYYERKAKDGITKINWIRA